MTTHVKVCYGCPLRHQQVPGRITPRRCPILQAKLDDVRGLGLTRIDFDCPTKRALFKPGQCVVFMGADHDAYSDMDRYSDFTGYVLGWDGPKVRVVSEETDKPFCRIYPHRLTLRSEPARRVCIHCGLPEGVRIKVKMQMDPEPRPWVCREDYSATMEPIPLPCEYAEVQA